MSSSPASTFVFIQLPSTEEVVVAGRFVLQVVSGGAVGRFRYGKSYLARENAIPLDPVHLPLAGKEFRTALNGGLFGALRDAAPDFWGRTVIERRGHPVNELGYLLATADIRVGALSFGPTPEPPTVDYEGAVPLERLARAASSAAAHEAAIDGKETDEVLDPAFLDPSSGVGGARPKAVVIDEDGQLWIAKFPSRTDRWDNALAEATYLRLAAECGIRTPETRIITIGEKSILLVRRFDQTPGTDGPRRRGVLSAHTLLGLTEDVVDRSGWSYIDLAHLLRRTSTSPAADARELFLRMTFNALTSNLDDHPRNHSVLWEEGGWRLSPAYDLTPSATRSQDERLLAMSIGSPDRDRPRWANRANLVSAAPHFGVAEHQAHELISAMKARVLERWRPLAGELGGDGIFAEQIAHAFPDRYPGFEYQG
jgi:serine/threonine-protein kinase HipA